ncbi:MAG TPA: transketolase [Kiritimatiellia bacterium]|nr:transketolase [Kiritimatiellia bacterium]
MSEQTLKADAVWVRRQVLEMIVSAGHGHIGGSLSCTDILVALYRGGILRVKSDDPAWPERDRFIMSKGHSSEALYAVLARSGFIPVEELATYGKDGSRLGGHVDRSIPGIEVSTGSLGQGLGIGAGMALAARRLGQKHMTFVLMGDGECYEGSVWEAAQFAAQHRLFNLVAIVDRNRQITLDDTEVCNRQEPFADKWRAFGWEPREVDGHSFSELLQAFGGVRDRIGKAPLVVIARTIKGRGVSFMEREIGWHHGVPKGERVNQARQDLASKD